MAGNPLGKLCTSCSNPIVFCDRGMPRCGNWVENAPPLFCTLPDDFFDTKMECIPSPDQTEGIMRKSFAGAMILISRHSLTAAVGGGGDVSKSSSQESRDLARCFMKACKQQQKSSTQEGRALTRPFLMACEHDEKTVRGKAWASRVPSSIDRRNHCRERLF